MRRARWWIGALLIALIAWAVWRWASAPRASFTVVAARPDSTSVGFKAAILYFAAPSGDSLVSESREMIEQPELHARVEALVAELERGPTAAGLATLPKGTSMLHVFLDDGGTMTLDLSGAFQQRFHGGSSAEYLAIASLVRTMGANVPEAKRVLLTCAGAPLATLGGHLPLDRPIDVATLP